VTSPEPFQKLVHQGMILGEIEYTLFKTADGRAVSAAEISELDGGYVEKKTKTPLVTERVSSDRVEKRGQQFVLASDPESALDARAHKMSKARGNVVNPDDIVQKFGADSLRLYEMFMGPLEATKPWNTDGILGVRRFLERVWNLCAKKPSDAPAEGEIQRLLHRTIRKVSEDIDALRFNTAISAMMVLSNELHAIEAPPRDAVEALVLLVHPFAPHAAEELWVRLGHSPSVQVVPWPSFDPALCEEAVLELPVQVNGKVRGRITIAKDADEASVLAAAERDEGVARNLEGKTVVKKVYVPGRIVTFVVK
jgi:leucyl-tRNA synthetase